MGVVEFSLDRKRGEYISNSGMSCSSTGLFRYGEAMIHTPCFPNGVAHQPQHLLPYPQEEPLLHGSSVAIPAIGRIPFDGYEEKRFNRFGEKWLFFWRVGKREAIVWERRKYHSLIVVYEDAEHH